MDTNKILAELKAERDKITKAIEVLTGLSKSPTTKSPSKPAGTKTTSKSRISAAARKKMADAQKKRWAAFRAKKAAAAKKS